MSGHDLTADDFLGKVQFNHRLQTPRNSLVPGRPIEDVKKMSTSNGPRRGTDYRVAVNLPNGDKAKVSLLRSQTAEHSELTYGK